MHEKCKVKLLGGGGAKVEIEMEVEVEDAVDEVVGGEAASSGARSRAALAGGCPRCTFLRVMLHKGAGALGALAHAAVVVLIITP